MELEVELERTDSGADRAGLRLSHADLVPLVLALFWGFAGVAKTLDYAAFRDVAIVHGVLPESLVPFVWLVPLGEGCLSLGMLLSIGRSSGVRALRITLCVGVLLVLTFAVYIWLVPQVVLEQVGCGCFGTGAARVVSGIPLSARTTSLVLAGVLIAAHALAFELSAGPRSVERRVGTTL